MSCGRGGLSFHRSSSFFALVLLLVRHPQSRPPSSRILYPCKPFFEDVEFNRLCLEAKLAVVKCRRFVMFKLGHRVEWGCFSSFLIHSFSSSCHISDAASFHPVDQLERPQGELGGEGDEDLVEVPLAECSSVSRTTNKGVGDQLFLAQVAGYMERTFRVSFMALNVSTDSLPPTFSVL